MAKLPYMKWFPASWIQDTRPLSLAAKGAWIDIICMAWEAPERGVLRMPIAALSRAIGATEDETKCALDELRRYDICKINANQNGDVTLVCRRITREETGRQKTRQRVQRHRLKDSAACDPNSENHLGNANCNASVTPYSLESRNNTPLLSPLLPVTPNVCENYEQQFSPTTQKVFDVWARERKRYRLATVRDFSTQQGAAEIAGMIDRKEVDAKAVVSAFKEFLRRTHNDNDYELWTLRALAKNLSQWIPKEKTTPNAVAVSAQENEATDPRKELEQAASGTSPYAEKAKRLLERQENSEGGAQ